MMTLIAAALAAAQPAPPAPQPQHGQMQMDHSGKDKAMDCCKDCCKDMDKRSGHDMDRMQDHQEHKGG